MMRILNLLVFGLYLAGASHAFANPPIFFHCKGSGGEYQIIFEHDDAKKT